MSQNDDKCNCDECNKCECDECRKEKGLDSKNSSVGINGYAEYNCMSQSPNTFINPLPKGKGFTLDTEKFNTIPNSISYNTVENGTVFILNPGVYLINCETSLVAPGSIGLYFGNDTENMEIDNNTVAGSQIGGSWISKQSTKVVNEKLFMTVSSVDGEVNVEKTGGEGEIYMIRVSFMKI